MCIPYNNITADPQTLSVEITRRRLYLTTRKHFHHHTQLNLVHRPHPKFPRVSPKLSMPMHMLDVLQFVPEIPTQPRTKC